MTVRRRKKPPKPVRADRYVVEFSLAPGSPPSPLFMPGVWYASDGAGRWERSSNDPSVPIERDTTIVTTRSNLSDFVEDVRRAWRDDYEGRWAMMVSRVRQKNGKLTRLPVEGWG